MCYWIDMNKFHFVTIYYISLKAQPAKFCSSRSNAVSNAKQRYTVWVCAYRCVYMQTWFLHGRRCSTPLKKKSKKKKIIFFRALVRIEPVRVQPHVSKTTPLTTRPYVSTRKLEERKLMYVKDESGIVWSAFHSHFQF